MKDTTFSQNLIIFIKELKNNNDSKSGILNKIKRTSSRCPFFNSRKNYTLKTTVYS